MKTRILITMAMLWTGACLAQLPAKDGVLLYGDFVHNIGLVDLTGWSVSGGISNADVRGLSISVGQLCAVNPDTGSTITDTNNLVPAVLKTLVVKHGAQFVNGNVAINTQPSSIVTEKLKVAGSIQSTLAGSTGGYMFADTSARRESRLETAYALVPIGGVVAFFKFSGWYLPPNFKECDGTQVSDVDSPMNGQSVPNLNANGNGATIQGNSAATGGFEGANTINLTEAQMPAHDHDGLTGWEADHNHAASTGVDGQHTHTAASMSNPGNHSHSYWALNDDRVEVDSSWSASQDDPIRGNWSWASTSSDGGSHTHSFTTTDPGNHAHTISDDGAHDHEITSKGSNANVDNRQRSCQLAWIIRIK